MCNLNTHAPQRSCGDAQSPLRQSQAALNRFWEIDHFFRCPILGMCLTAAEQRQLLKKCGFDPRNKSPYEIHEILVTGAESENRLSRKIESLLQRKFAQRASTMAALSEEELLQRWQVAYQGGDYFAELWAMASRRDLSLEARREIFGTIHMAMHTNAEQTARTAFRLNLLQKKVNDQEKKLKRLNRDRRALRKENEALQHALVGQHQCPGAAVAHTDPRPRPAPGATDTAALQQENQRLSALLQKQADTLHRKERRLKSLVKDVARLTGELEAQRQAEEVLHRETQENLRAFMEMNRCDSDCPSFNLCCKRVLIVGGIARMEALYRQLIETNGGVFEYHDGYMNGGVKQLESSLKRSDIVLCPVNCNSHTACTMVKNLGKKHNKPVHMLPSFSLSTVSQIIRTCGAGQVAN